MVGLWSKQGTVCYVIKTMVSIKIELKCSSLHLTSIFITIFKSTNQAGSKFFEDLW